MQQLGSQDWRAGRIREWLLLLLRFAITCDPKDQAAAFAMADEIDAFGHQWRPSAPSFFRRTSDEVCAAITALDDPKRATILKKHIPCCARAASGRAAATPPSSVMKSRRFTQSPRRQERAACRELGDGGPSPF
jgi:hypothetical protein